MSALSENYAIALFELALEEKVLDDVRESFSSFTQSLDAETLDFFTHPKLSKAKKKNVVSACDIEPVLRDFLYVIVDNNRFNDLHEIHKSFEKFLEKKGNIMRVVVYSQKALAKSRIESLKEEYAKNYKRQVVIENTIDETIIGGLRFEFDGMIVDNTVNHTLEEIKSRLTK